MTTLSNIKSFLCAFALTTCLCQCGNDMPISYYWNEEYGYGTPYPTFLGKQQLAQNGKGFSMKDGECELWADLYYDRTDEDGELLVAREFLNGYPGPETIVDTTYSDGGFIIMDKVVVFDMQFLELWCKYPASEQQSYGELFCQCFDMFPQLNMNE